MKYGGAARAPARKPGGTRTSAALGGGRARVAALHRAVRVSSRAPAASTHRSGVAKKCCRCDALRRAVTPPRRRAGGGGQQMAAVDTPPPLRSAPAVMTTNPLATGAATGGGNVEVELPSPAAHEAGVAAGPPCLPPTITGTSGSSSGGGGGNRCWRRTGACWRAAAVCLRQVIEAVVICASPRRDSYTAPEASPFGAAGWLSKLYFAWASPFVAFAAYGGRQVQMADLWPLRRQETAADAARELQALWEAEVAAARARHVAPSLGRAAWRMVRCGMVRVAVLKMGWLLFSLLSNALLLREIIAYFSSSHSVGYGIGLVFAFLASETLRSASVNQHWLTASLTGIRLRAAARQLLYAKVLRAQRSPLTVGAAVNMLVGDTQRLQEACQYGEFVFSTPVTVLATLGVLWSQLGPSSLAGFAVLLVASPLQARFGKWVGDVRRATVKVTDERAKVMTEVLSGMRLLKLYGWEAAFADKVARIRQREVAALLRAANIRTLNSVIAFSVPVLVTLATFTVHEFWTGEPLTPAMAFIAISVFNVARFPLGLMPLATKQISEAAVAAGRLQSILLQPELQPDDQPILLPTTPTPPPPPTTPMAMAKPPGADAAATDAAATDAAGAVSVSVSVSASASDAEQLAAAAAALQRLTGDATLPPHGIAVEARGATFHWPTMEPPAAAGSRGSGGRSAAASTATATAATSAATATNAAAAAAPVVRGITDVSFVVPTGSCTAVVGAVGCGKSSLLAALLGNLVRVRGAFVVRAAGVVYAAQSPWVFSGSVRDNILFGEPYDEARYRRVVAVCALQHDLDQFAAGDATEIGERGINLSGGQRARVGLARAVYSPAQLLLLDDPLSAVDVAVGRTLWRDAIVGELRRAGRTVILVTHQLQYLAEADQVVMLADGRVTACGTYADLVAAGVDMSGMRLPPSSSADDDDDAVDDDPPLPPALMSPSAAASGVRHRRFGGSDEPSSPSAATTAAATTTASAAAAPAAAAVAVPAAAAAAATAAVGGESSDGVARKVSASARGGAAAAAGGGGGGKRPADVSGALTVAEDRAGGAVSWSTVTTYFRTAGSAYLVGLILAVLLVAKGVRLGSDTLVAKWTQNVTAATPTAEARLYLGMYAVTVAGVILTTLAQSLLFAWVTLRAARNFHDRAFASVMRAQPAWLDTQPTGRILSRFTGDLDTIDSAMPPNIEQASELQVQVLLSLVLICVVFPWFLLPLAPILLLFRFIAQYFRRAARDLKRLDSVARSPLVSHFQATFQGLETVRSYRREAAFNGVHEANTDAATRAYWAFYAANRWVAVRLDVQTTVVAAVTVALCVGARNLLAPSLAALSITTALQISGIAQFSLRLLTETEAQFTSVERLEWYATGIPHEAVTAKPPAALPADVAAAAAAATAAAGAAGAAAASRGAVTSCGFPAWYPAAWDRALVAAAWPARGDVVFDGVCARYRDGLPLVLDGVSFAVRGGARVGCVGRTGSGKTTTTLALFRMMELAGGRITVDGVDIARVNVYQLRSRLAVIPQDPTLYSGSLRANLDVFGEYSDAAVAAAVAKAGLSDFVAAHPRGLARDISEGGSNISLGERQLIALARALLRNARVVVLDEATASVDNATDAAIQTSIRANMAGATLFIVAHRLHTIMDCDRVLVLERGRVAEYDAPAALLGLAPRLEPLPAGGGVPGAFARMVDDTGATVAPQLRATAAAAYRPA